jgi:hypothetical protein
VIALAAKGKPSFVAAALGVATASDALDAGVDVATGAGLVAAGEPLPDVQPATRRSAIGRIRRCITGSCQLAGTPNDAAAAALPETGIHDRAVEVLT